MKHMKAFRRQITMADQTVALLVSDIRGAQQLACVPGALAKNLEYRSFELMQKAITLRDEIRRFHNDIQP